MTNICLNFRSEYAMLISEDIYGIFGGLTREQEAGYVLLYNRSIASGRNYACM